MSGHFDDEPLYPVPEPRQRGLLARLLYSVLFFGSAVAGVGIAAVIGLYIYFTYSLPDPATLADHNRVVSVTFVDSTGTIIASRGSAFGDDIRLNELPAYLPAAFMAVEDRRFYDHPGFDLVGLARALRVNLAAGEFVQGGSTITQQLARVLFLDPERTLSRKTEELFLAIWLELNLSKDEILALYLNRIYLGGGAYGVDAAARRYFGVSAREVTLPQAALLAALTTAPSRLAPTTDEAAARARTETVIAVMEGTGIITAEEAVGARAAPAPLKPAAGDESVNYYADYAFQELKTLGIPLDKNVVVTVAINAALQGEAAAYLTKILSEDGAARQVGQGAIVTLATDGAIRVLIGGRDYRESQFDRAVQAARQPGSSFKAFVYMAGLEYGLTPDTVRRDAPLEIEGWSPGNYTENYVGRVTLREAFAKSLNTVAVRVSEEAGREMVVAAAQRAGIESPLSVLPSIALGAVEVNLLELTGAYGAFATQGLKVDPYAIIEVKSQDGQVLYQRQAPVERERVMEEHVAIDMTQMMFETIRTGTGRGASLGSRPAAGKTGTTQSYRDAWFMGFTADFITGVWVGNDDNSAMQKVVGGSLPATIWRQVMTAAHKGMEEHELAGAKPHVEPVVVAGNEERDFYENYDPYTDDSGDYQEPPRERRRSDDEDDESLWDWLFGEDDPPPPEPRRRRRR